MEKHRRRPAAKRIGRRCCFEGLARQSHKYNAIREYTKRLTNAGESGKLNAEQVFVKGRYAVGEGTKIQLFEDQKIRSAWDDEEEEWYFSIVDVVAVLTEQKSQRGASNYWAKLKQRLKEEGADQLLTKCQQLKMTAADGKKRNTDVANTEQLLRIIQSIPSPKAEPFKLWLAQTGRERIEETIDPEITIERALATYLKKGYSREWVNQRLQAIQVRKELTDEWQNRGMKAGMEFAILTDEITHAWSGMTTREYKKLKGLKKENLHRKLLRRIKQWRNEAVMLPELQGRRWRQKQESRLSPREMRCS